MNQEIKTSVNKEVLKSFKPLQKNKVILYTIAHDEYLVSINDKSMIVYDNPSEIDFKGTFKLTRNKLIPVADCALNTNTVQAIDLTQFTKLGEFGKNMDDLQKFCYDQGVRLNLIDIFDSVEQLLSVYKHFKLYKNNNKAEIMLTFKNDKHKTFLLSKLV